MKVLQRVATVVLALSLVSLLASCSPPNEGGDPELGGSGRLSPADQRAMQHRRAMEQADKLLASGYLKVGQALYLANSGIQAKLQGNASLKGSAAPTTAPATTSEENEGYATGVTATPRADAGGLAPEPRTEPAEEAKPSEGEAAAPAAEGGTEGETVGAAEEGQAAATEPATPQLPEIIPQGALAIQMLDQAYVLIKQVDEEVGTLFTGEFASEPRVQSLKSLLETIRALVLSGAKMDPINADLLAALAAAEQAAAAAAGEGTGEEATAGEGTSEEATAGEGTTEGATAEEGTTEGATAEESGEGAKGESSEAGATSSEEKPAAGEAPARDSRREREQAERNSAGARVH